MAMTSRRAYFGQGIRLSVSPRRLKRTMLAGFIWSSVLAGMIQVDAAEALGEPITEDQAIHASNALQASFAALKRTIFHNPYRLEIDLASGGVSAENDQVRWVFNLKEMDPDRIALTPEGKPGYQSARVRVWCEGGHVGRGNYCVDWGSRFTGTLRMDPGVYPYFDFKVYTGSSPEPHWAMWTRTARDLEAEERMMDLFRVLIRYFRQQREGE